MNTLPFRSTSVDRLAIEIHPDRNQLGRAAAHAAAVYLRDVIARQGEARVMFACAPSQDEFLAALIDPTLSCVPVEWSRVTAFHMDEYVGLTADEPQSFRYYLHQHLLNHVKVRAFHPLAGEAEDLDSACRDYAALLREQPVDLICAGIGENGHIAFNDPSVADFDDPASVKVVKLEESCRQQQVNDSCFSELAQVPSHALTVTIPVFRHASRVSLHVPGPRKAAALHAMLRGPIETHCPASVLRTHPNATLYIDEAAAARSALET